MNSMTFLLTRSAKNTLLELPRKPMKLVLVLLTLVLIVGVLVLSLYTRTIRDTYADLVWVKGILFLLMLIFFIVSVQKGLGAGDVIFEMNDVNLLFVSPARPWKILLYGVSRMMKMAFWAGFFLLFQSNTLGMFFGVSFGGVLVIFGGFMVTVCLLQIGSLVLFSQTRGRPARRRAGLCLCAALFAPLAVMAFRALAGGVSFPALEALLRSPALGWTPAAGWMAEGVTAFLAGDPARGAVFLGLLILAGAALMVFSAVSNPDYYEDVLVASETAFEKKRALAEGQLNLASGKTVRVKATGVGGWGASAFFYKHLRESFRANRLGLWGLSSIIPVAAAVLLACFLPQGGSLLLLQALMWTQIFLIGTSRGMKELLTPYIYRVPASSLSKILWSSLESLVKVLVESLAAFGLAGLIMGEHPLLVAAVIVVYTLFTLLLLGVNYLFLRWTAVDVSAGLMVVFYMLAVMAVMLPGVAAAVAVGFAVKDIGPLLAMGVLALWELLAALGCFALARGILHRCDMLTLKLEK